MLFRKKTDDEWIANIRRMVQFWDRWRFIVTIVVVSVLIGFFVTLMMAWQSVTNDDPFTLEKFNRTGMLISLFIGLNLGVNLTGAISYLAKSIFGGFRTERIILKLHSEVESLWEIVDA